MEKNILLICECHSKEHQIIISNDEDFAYCSIHLNKLPFFKRLINGIKYIFGYRCKYGDFDEFLFSKEHINELKKIIKFLEKQ